MRRELNIFFNALMFYSRIPVPFKVEFSEDLLNKATRYFTLVGIIIGALGALVLLVGNFFFPLYLAVALSMVATIFITGAFHEDGFADFCDGFGGGYAPEKILEIMKDSRIGTYGSIGLIAMLAVKYLSLISIPVVQIPLVLISGHAFSRFLPVCMIYASKYVRMDLTSKVKPIGHRDSAAAFLVAMCFGLVFLFFLPFTAVLVILPVAAMLFFVFKTYVEKKLTGYTGDVLGALQQLAEVCFYLCYIAVENN